MKKIGWVLFVLMIGYALWQLSLSIMATTDTEEWATTKATVLETRNRLRRKTTRAYAMVTFVTRKGQPITTEVEVMAIPFYGTTLSKNDTVTILYDPEKPMLAKTPSTSFMESYGLYLLVGAGIVLSIFNLKKVRSKKLKT